MGPYAKLASSIVLSAVKQDARALYVGRTPAGKPTVELRFDDRVEETMRPPEIALGPIVRVLAQLGRVPDYAEGSVGTGNLELEINGHGHVRFSVRVEGHGTDQRALLTRESG